MRPVPFISDVDRMTEVVLFDHGHFYLFLSVQYALPGMRLNYLVM